MTSRDSLILITATLIILLLGLPFLTLAQSLTYQPLVGIPGVSNDANGFNSYINQLYFLSISLAALLAVIKIIIGGVKWMLTDVVTSKSDAKNDIRSALLGLLLIVSAVLILGTINPQLRELNVLGGAPALNPLPSAGARPANSGTPANNGSNPEWVTSQRERCQSNGGTWSEPSTLFRNGNCTYPRGTVPQVQSPRTTTCSALQGASGQNCLELLAEPVGGSCASGFTLQQSSTGPGCVRTSYDPQGNPCNAAYESQGGLCVAT